jgi:AcrR family transcriptional regulator
MAYTPVGTKRRGIDPAVSRQRVLDAAEELILKGEFASATVTELADLAGVSRATVFSRFGSKLGVLQELSVRCAGGPEMRAIRAASAIEDPVEAVKAIIDASCNHWELQGHILLTLKAVVELEPGVVQMIDNQRKDQRGVMEDLARGLKRVGHVHGLSVDEAASALHLITSVETFMELRRNAGLSLNATKKVLRTMADRTFDLS